MKFVLLVLVLVVALWLLLRTRRRAPDDARNASGRGERMLVCAHCGVHLPRSEALIANGHAYCGAAHRDAGPASE